MVITATTAAAAIAAYLAKSLKENKAIAAFFNDFTDASVTWIRPVFLKENGTPKKVIDDLLENPDDPKLQDKVQTLIEDKAEDDADALELLRDMFTKIAEKTGGNITTTTNTVKVKGNNNNIMQGVKDSTINIGNITQTHSGSGDNIARDKVVNHTYYGNRPIDPHQNSVWKEMLAAHKIKEAIEYLMQEREQDTDSMNTLYQLLGQFNFNEGRHLKELISNEEANRTRNRIMNALLETFGKD